MVPASFAHKEYSPNPILCAKDGEAQFITVKDELKTAGFSYKSTPFPSSSSKITRLRFKVEPLMRHLPSSFSYSS